MSQPNILIFTADQLNRALFPGGPADWLPAPNLKKLAARATRFANAYSASRLCAPGGRRSCLANYQPLQQVSERYMRNHMDLNVLEENPRFPRGE